MTRPSNDARAPFSTTENGSIAPSMPTDARSKRSCATTLPTTSHSDPPRASAPSTLVPAGPSNIVLTLTLRSALLGVQERVALDEPHRLDDALLDRLGRRP